LKEIRKILTVYDASKDSEENFALASVVNVEESSYRRIGARMLVSSTGNWIGGISGGCLEGDALERSQKAIFNNQASTIIYDTMDDDDKQIGVGLGCNGRLEVLFRPIDKSDPQNPAEQLRQLLHIKEAAVMIKVIDASANVKLLGKSILAENLTDDFQFCNMDTSILKSQIGETKTNAKSQILNLENKSGEKLKLLFEFIRPEMKLIIVGDNYDVNSLLEVASVMGWEIQLVGRAKKFSKEIFAKVKRVTEYEDFNQLNINEYTAVVLMSHDYNWDKTILSQVIDKEPTYLGLLGPKKRMLKLKNELGLEALDKQAHFYAPVGLDIGAESPEEIALSICAEIVAIFRNREGGFLRERVGTIHFRS